MKIILKIILPLVLVGGIYAFLSFKNILPSFGIFKSQEIQLRETPLILEDVKDIAELFTATSYEEIFIDTTKAVENSTLKKIFTFKKNHGERFVLLARGTCMAGTDLSGISESDIVAQDSSLSIKIPEATIISTIVNPSDYEIYIDEGTWTPNEVKKIKSYAENKIRQLAIKDGLLVKAQARTELLLKQFFNSIGYTNVTIEKK
jgi:hypothetical protein